MDIAAQLPLLLGLAWLAPLVSFVAILFFGPRMGPHGRNAAWVATAAIVTSLVLSLFAAGTWLGAHPVQAAHHGAGGHDAGEHGESHAAADAAGHAGHASDHGEAHGPLAYAGDWYTDAATSIARGVRRRFALAR
jgi:hypothetical protein